MTMRQAFAKCAVKMGTAENHRLRSPTWFPSRENIAPSRIPGLLLGKQASNSAARDVHASSTRSAIDSRERSIPVSWPQCTRSGLHALRFFSTKSANSNPSDNRESVSASQDFLKLYEEQISLGVIKRDEAQIQVAGKLAAIQVRKRDAQ